MHNVCIQIYNTKYSAEEHHVAFSEHGMYESLQNWVDYVTVYPNQKREIRRFLDILSRNGCAIDYDRQTFTVENKDMFAAFCLDLHVEKVKELCSRKMDSCADLALLFSELKTRIYGACPTIVDECGYGSLFEATRYDLFSPFRATTEEKPTYRLVRVADCHY